MINTYDLYDLYAVFARIRFHPDHPLNEAIMDRIISVLNDRESSEPRSGNYDRLTAIVERMTHSDQDKRQRR